MIEPIKVAMPKMDRKPLSAERIEKMIMGKTLNEFAGEQKEKPKTILDLLEVIAENQKLLAEETIKNKEQLLEVIKKISEGFKAIQIALDYIAGMPKQE